MKNIFINLVIMIVMILGAGVANASITVNSYDEDVGELAIDIGSSVMVSYLVTSTIKEYSYCLLDYGNCREARYYDYKSMIRFYTRKNVTEKTLVCHGRPLKSPYWRLRRVQHRVPSESMKSS